MEKLYPLFKIAALIAKEKIEGLSTSEKEIVQRWISENENNSSLYKKLQDGEILATDLHELKKFDSNKAFIKIDERITKETRRFKIIRMIPDYMKYAAVVVLLIIGSYFIINKVVQDKPSPYVQNNILPGKQRAILITAGNQQIVLGNPDKKQIIKEGSANIVNSGSVLSYHKNDSVDHAQGTISYNTLITPRGGEYTLVLSDGTMVMLNADSKLIYPVVFDSNVREVKLEGEAFFKVAISAKVPFIVKANDINVTVYGTVFNVAAYNNENQVQTTLVEGSVGVHINSDITKSETKITPGQQLTFNKNTGKTETREVNTELFTAWTKGKFVFENEPVENILKAMSRWYNFDVVFEKDNLKKQRFTLTLDKYADVSKILDMMSSSSALKFSANGNKISVSAK